ncbi:MAG: hypothetical protein ABJA64_01835, partial [Candidatus Saccharibacteria bacterium]
RHQYFSLNNVVMLVAFLIAASWAWGSVAVMQRNYNLQQAVDDKSRLLQLAQLETENLQFEQRFYNSDEYKELAVRERLGLVRPGESVLVLPPNTQDAKDADVKLTNKQPASTVEPSNFEQWANFIFGGNSQHLQ